MYTNEAGRLIQHAELINNHLMLKVNLPNTSQLCQPGQVVTVNNRNAVITDCDTTTSQVELLYPNPENTPPKSGVNISFNAQSPYFDTDDIIGRPLILTENEMFGAAIFFTRKLIPSTLPALTIMEFTSSSPFRPHPSRMLVPGLPEGVIATMPLLEQWSVPNRICSTQDWPGCYDGSAAALAQHWLEQQTENAITVCICGSEKFVAEGIETAQQFQRPYQSVTVES